jgi:uncharacterized phage-like protein YoqJ
MAEPEKTCCFTGHRPSKLPWREDERDPRCIALKREISQRIEELYLRGCRHFICGMALGCDLYFGEIVAQLRESHPDITLEAAIPCATQSEGWGWEAQARYERLRQLCDQETLIQQHYDRSCMQRRNRYMVDRSSLLIAAYNGTAGGTRNTVQYAMERGLEIVDLPVPFD